MRTKLFLTAVALLGYIGFASAAPINFTFLENGTGPLGTSSTFLESGVSITAYSSPGETLYGKNDGPGETGLGTASDSEHEINPNNYVQLNVVTSPIMKITTLFFGSIQTSTLGERADIYYSTSLGSLGLLLGSVSGLGSGVTGSFDVSGLGYTSGYYNITGGVGNIVFAGVTVDSVPDAASTAALLGGTLASLGLVRRKLMV